MPNDRNRELHRLRKAITQSREQGRHYGPEVRAQVVGWIREEEREGRSVRQSARALGLVDGTVRYWMGQEVLSPAAFVPVVAEACAAGSRRLALVLAGGARVEGLSLQDVAELCREVGS